MSTISAGNTSATCLTITNDYTGNLALVATSGLIDAASCTGAITIPKGTTDQRPASPVNGMIRYNTSLSQYEFYGNGRWNSYI